MSATMQQYPLHEQLFTLALHTCVALVSFHPKESELVGRLAIGGDKLTEELNLC